MKNINKICLLLLLSSSIFAQGVGDIIRLSEKGILSGPRSLSMGNAYSAISDDFSATLFNPAGLAFAKKLQFDGGFSFDNFNNDVTFFGNNTKQNSNDNKLNQVGFVFPFPTARGSFSLALGYNQNKSFNKVVEFNGFNPGNNSMIQDLVAENKNIMYDLGLSYEVKGRNGYQDTTIINGKLNQSGKLLHSGSLNSWLIASAIEIEKDIFFGGVLNIYSGKYKRTRNYSETDTKDYYPSTLRLDPKDAETAGFESVDLYDGIDWDITGYDLKIGLLAKLENNLDLGFTIKFPSSFTIKESFSESGISNFSSSPGFEELPTTDKYEYDISTPYEFAAGLAYYGGDLLLSGEATLIDYTKSEFAAGFDKTELKIMNDEVKNALHMVINLNAGVEYLFSDLGLALRAGFMYKPSVYKDDPSDYDKKFITGGFGYNLTKKMQLNVGYAYGWWKDYQDNYSENKSRTFQDINTNTFVAGIKYIF